MHFVTMFL